MIREVKNSGRVFTAASHIVNYNYNKIGIVKKYINIKINNSYLVHKYQVNNKVLKFKTETTQKNM
jgi:hypothetical protein